MKNVIKRDGVVVPFDKEKIKNAIMKAMIDTGVINEEIANFVALSCAYLQEETKSIYEIEQYIIEELTRLGRSDAAIAYHDYKMQRTEERCKNDAIYKEFKSVIECEDVKNSNANVDEYSFGGRKFEASSIIHKDLALKLLPKRVSDAHKNNIVYQHDLDSHTVGMHNCLNADLPRLLANGFKTRNGDCRPANSINTAMQLTAVIFQIQSQDQFGGVGSMHFDYDIAPYVKKSFKKHLKKSLNRSILTDDVKDKILEMEELLRPCSNFKNEIQERIPELNETINSLVFTNAWNYAIDDLEEEGKQSAQALYHNLNTLESRPGSQVPFTSINFGTDTSCEGRLVSKWILNASVDGIGKFHRTSIFPISIFQYKKGINDKKGTPNYDLYEKVLESISKRIYPNIVNCNWSQNIEDESDIDTVMSTMGK